MVLWLRLQAPNAEGPGALPGQVTRFCMPQVKIPGPAAKT